MISAHDLYTIAKSRFDEAKILNEQDKPDGAVYLCGYSLELMLKRHIVKLLEWDAGYPELRNDFNSLQSYRTHDLEVLLKLSGLEKIIREDDKLFTLWQKAAWKSEFRYRKIGSIAKSEAAEIIEATRNLLNYILKKYPA